MALSPDISHYFCKKWLESALQSYFGTNEAIIDVNTSRIGQNVGFVSVILRLELSWENSARNISLPTSVILKIPCVEEAGVDFGSEEEAKESWLQLVCLLNPGLYCLQS